ncbi:MAG: CHAT domain-containing protein [Bacteroidota bacterium]
MVRFFLVVFYLAGAVALRAQTEETLLATTDSLLLAARYQEAEQYIVQWLSQNKDEELNRLATCKMAEALIAQGKLTEAENRLTEIKSAQWQLRHREAIYLTTFGYLQLNKGRHDLAVENLQKAYALFQLNARTNTRAAARCLSYLSLTYLATGKYKQAEDNGLIALQIRQQLLGDQHEEVAASYNDLGLVYSQTDPDKALSYYDMALPIYEHIHGKEHAKIAIANTNMGALYLGLKLYGDAVTNFETALAIWRKIYPQGHPNEAIVLRFLGQTYVRMGNHTSAYQYFDQSLAKYKQNFGEKHPDIASTLNQVALLKLSDRQFEAALQLTQEAICANITGYSEQDYRKPTPLANYYNANVLLASLRQKAQALEELYYGKTLKLTDLKDALNNLYSCDSLIDEIRHHSTDESDKITLGATASEVYEDGVRVAFALSEMTVKPEPYKEAAFYFAEKSKSAVLQESIADTQAKSFSGIPTELVEEEKNLKATISFLSQKLSSKPNAEEEKYLRETLFQLNIDYTNFVKKLEREFPNYYNLKFNSSTPSTRDLQQLLNPQQAIVSYFIAEKTGRLYQFILTGNAFRIRNLTLPADFERLTKGWMNSLYYRSFEAYSQTAPRLQKLLVPPLPTRIKEVTLLPSGRLGTLPFEALPTGKVRRDFASQPYLAGNYGISYEFSAGLLLQKDKGTGLQKASSIFLCAPVEFTGNDGLGFLPGSETEVQTISSLFGNRSQVVTHSQASETTIKHTDLSQFRYLHFATHGIVDERSPELSRIFLNTDDHEDGHLYAGEIYNLSLSADLAVLSACQTGLGKISKGEGVIGLSRALVYAGAKNLVVSFWSVADESTTQLMTDFYRFLLADPGGNYKIALQKAKQKMIQEKRFAEPYFWAPFILIGN